MAQHPNKARQRGQQASGVSYRVGPKNGYRVIYILVAALCLFFTLGSLYSMVTSDVQFFWTALFFGATSAAFLLELRTGATVYKNGKLVYTSRFRKKEYLMKDLYLVDPTKYGSDHVEIVIPEGWEMICEPYNAQGKKLFTLGFSYRNVDRLVADLRKQHKNVIMRHPEDAQG